jgi:hypothetical protein
MSTEEAVLLGKAEEIAKQRYDGNFTVMRFTTNSRVGFGTPDGSKDIAEMSSGKTLKKRWRTPCRPKAGRHRNNHHALPLRRAPYKLIAGPAGLPGRLH